MKVLFAASLLFFVFSLSAQNISEKDLAQAQAYLEAADTYRGIPDTDFMLSMHVRDTLNQQLRREISTTTYIHIDDDVQMTLSIIHSDGRDNGSLILQKDNNMWYYQANTRNAIRISASQRLLGGASYADVSSTSYTQHYEVMQLEETTLGNTPVYLLHLTKKNNGAAYHRIQYYLAQKDSRPVKSEFFTQSGRLLKTMYFRNFRSIGVKKTMSTQWIIVDGLNPQIVAYLDITDIQAQGLPENYFQENALPSLSF